MSKDLAIIILGIAVGLGVIMFRAVFWVSALLKMWGWI